MDQVQQNHLLLELSLFAYVCGFEGDKDSMCKFEHRWKSFRDYERRRGMDCIKQIARIPSGMVEYWIHLDLTLALNVTD